MIKKTSYFVIAFNITDEKNLKKIKKAWQKEAQLDASVGRLYKSREATTENVLGGQVALMRVVNNIGKIVKVINVRTPMGLAISKDKTLYTGSNHWIYEIKNGKVVRELNNFLFNCIHGLFLTKRNTLLVVSTGIDAILEISPLQSDKITWSWFAPEQGFPISKIGNVRTLDYSSKLQGIEYSTPLHTTHVNSIIEEDGEILATLFHQGMLVKIDKKTGKTTILFAGLKNAHSIKKNKNEYLVCDTKGNRVFLLNKDFSIKQVLKNDFDWVQCALFSRDNDVIIADSNNGRIILWDRSSTQYVTLYKFKPGKKRIGSIIEIDKATAESVFGI